MTKFLNADLDTTLGGLTPSNYKVSSQKATKTYIDTEDNKKVDKTNTANQVYITDNNGDQETSTYSDSNTNSTFVKRTNTGQVRVATTPSGNNDATSKKYVDDINTSINTALNGKVDKTTAAKKVYATDGTGNQTTISYSNTINAGYLVQRDGNAQVVVPEVPVADENAASKKYVDDGLALKPDTASLDDVAFSGDYSDLINTPTYKTINSEIITGIGDIPLQTQLSGTDGNVVIYTSTTGTLDELGFDTTPTQNSNKLVKSGPIWTELHKKINYTDIVNDLTSGGVAVPLSAEQGKELDQKITLAQQSTHDRGIVLNALTSQGTNYTVDTATINTTGTDYVVGDALFYVSDLGIDTILNVISVDSTGGITGIIISQGGAFTNVPAATGVSCVGGSGSGAKFDFTATQVANSTLASLTNLQPNDFATVLYDEIHNNLRYVWKYVDTDGDGSYEWISSYPITNIERNFQSQPIENTELASNAVTTVKIADLNVTKEKLADNSVIARHITAGTITDSHVANGADIAQSKIHNLTTDLSNKVSRTSSAYQLYGTAAANTETTLTYKTDNTANTIVQRDANSQISVAQTPTANTHATSKKYVDDVDATKVDKVSGSKRVYGTDSQGNQTTYDYDSFGKVDDVKVGDTSVVVNKIASLGTMAGEDKNDYVLGNNAITSDTKCKITYDTKGLVIAGNDLIESDLPDIHLAKIVDVTATVNEVNKLHNLATTATELGYVSGVTSPIQAQIDSKQATITGGASSIVSSNLTVDRALISSSSGKVAVSTVTATELGYVSGVTSSIQTQLNSKQPNLIAGKGISIASNNTISTDRARVAFVAWND